MSRTRSRSRSRSRRSPGAIVALACCALLALGASATAAANEGQWRPDQIGELDAAELKALGLELEPTALWDASKGERDGGLLRAAVNLSGCSAAFISEDGLIATNHHCAFAAIQAQSSVEHDYLRDGFLARSRAQELEAKGKTVRVLRSVRDVSADVREQVAAAATPADKAKAAERATKTLVRACEEAGANLRCSVASFYNGSRYELFEYVELVDLRLVYAPPRGVGEYGGEIDNWMWPRHTGDFSLLRAYVDGEGRSAAFAAGNVPYHPAQYLQVSPEGVSPGDFVAVLGYPGRTDRYLSAPEVQRQVEQVLPRRVDLYGEWIAILERHGAADPAVGIKVAATQKGLANRHKNARGMVEGLTRMGLVARRQAQERELDTWAAEPGRERYRQALAQIRAASDEYRASFERDFLIANLGSGPKQLANAIDLVRRAREHGKPDLERVDAYMDREETSLRQRIEGRIRDYDEAVDIDLLASLIRRARELPAGAPLPALAGLVERETPEEAAARLIRGSSLAAPEKVTRLFAAHSPKKNARAKDPLLALAEQLVDEIEQTEAVARTRTGIGLDTGPLYFEMLAASRGGPVYPDANGTLRFSYATVQGYAKWDGQAQVPQTVLAEALRKHTGAEPFDLPQAVRDAAAGAGDSYWADPLLRDVPLCFLSNADTTGGNSGSPVIDGKGRLVGLNFDRVWENIAGDFGYNVDHSRNITVDARYLLWTLDEVEDAGELLEELGVAQYRDRPRRAAPSPPASPPAAASPEAAPAGCVSAGGDGTGATVAPAAILLLGLGWIGRRRRRRG